MAVTFYLHFNDICIGRVLKLLFLRERKAGCTFVLVLVFLFASVFALVHMCLSFETLILHEEERLAVSFYL